MKAETIEKGLVDWQERTLDELCSLRTELVEPSSSGSNRYVGLEHIDPGIPRIRRWGNDADLRSTKSRFYPGDVLYGKLRPYLDKAALVEWAGVCSTDILTLSPRTEAADPTYLSFLLHTSAFINHAVATTSGVNHPRTSWASISTFTHPIASLHEQRAIAAVLSKIQAAMEVQEKIVATLKELKAATMAKLFREGLRGEPLKQTEIGEIQGCWEVIRMGNICEKINYGTSMRCSSEKIGRPVLRIPNIINETVDTSNLKWAILSDQEVSKLLLEHGDLVFVRTNGNKQYTGRCAVYQGQPEGALFASYLIRVRLKKECILPKFAQAYLSLVGREQITSKAHPASDGKYNIDTGVLKNVLLPRPSMKEQERIVQVVEAMERRLGSAQKKANTAKSAFSSMLHMLMTGQVRVKDLVNSGAKTF